jgi:hypothetical protein
MAKFRVIKDIKSSQGGNFYQGEIIESTPDSKLQGFIDFKRKSNFGDKNNLILDFDIERVDDSTPLYNIETNPADFKVAVAQASSSDKTLTILSTIGALGGLYYAFSKKSGVGGYIGYVLLGGLVGSLIANVVKKVKK